MICSSVNLFFTSNLLSYGIGLQHHLLLKYGGTSVASELATNSQALAPLVMLVDDALLAAKPSEPKEKNKGRESA
jgi:hypothetical protein